MKILSAITGRCRTALLITALFTGHAHAQDPACAEMILRQPGSWGPPGRTENAPAAHLAVQKKFTEAFALMLRQNYEPKSVRADLSFSHPRINPAVPLAHYGLTLYAMQYSCSEGKLALGHETSTKMQSLFNHFSYGEINDTATDYQLTGYHRLARGVPVEIRPGIWRFPDQRVSLGFGNEGKSRLWLMTYDGKLPFSYVTRREFLMKRRRNLKRLRADDERLFRDRLAGWETQRKFKEQELKNDPAKLAAFMSGTYNPAIEREKTNNKTSMDAWAKAIDRVDMQLSAPAEDLGRPAIVVASSANFRDYDFVEASASQAEVLIKPNPAYFKGGAASTPQFITVEIIANEADPVARRFADDVERAIQFDYLKSFIGKPIPGALPAKPVMTTTAAPIPPSPAAGAAGSGTRPETTTPGPAAPPSAPAKPAAGTAAALSAPVGSAIVLACDGRDITVTVPRNGGSQFASVPVPCRSATGKYNLELKKVPPGMRGVVYPAGEGKTTLQVAIDHAYDLVTRDTGDKGFSTFYESSSPAIGGVEGQEGRYVVFVANTKGLGGADGKYRQIYWRDRNTGITKLISRAPTGEPANGDCYEPSVTADGQAVVFESRANNLAAADNNNFKDIFLWRAEGNAVELVTRTPAGAPADGESSDAMISGNGRHIVFTSLAGNLATTPKGRSVANVFVRDVAAGNTEMVSVDPVTRTGANGSRASISFDGSRISFSSVANTLVPGDNNNLWDIFVWQRGEPSLKRISMTHDGKERNAGTESASRQVASAISGDGRFVAFATTATNMVPGDNKGFQDVFVVEIATGRVSVASFQPGGQPSDGDSPIEQGERVAISYDGTWIAFPTKATTLGAPPSNVILYNAVTGKKYAVSDVKGSYTGRPAMSSTGAYVIFGKSGNLDGRFAQSGIFAHFTGNGPCRDCLDSH